MQALMIGRVGAAVDTSAYRVLVDRLWPRGVSKTDALWDIWLKEVARKWNIILRSGASSFRLACMPPRRPRCLKFMDSNRCIG